MATDKPALYDVLAAFYRQDPAARMRAAIQRLDDARDAAAGSGTDPQGPVPADRGGLRSLRPPT